MDYLRELGALDESDPANKARWRCKGHVSGVSGSGIRAGCGDLRFTSSQNNPPFNGRFILQVLTSFFVVKVFM